MPSEALAAGAGQPVTGAKPRAICGVICALHKEFLRWLMLERNNRRLSKLGLSQHCALTETFLSTKSVIGYRRSWMS